ncbi:MAG: hypothetical protein QNK04_32305 [Myxococcota bacterium]|nr:hypothetical protein [Myxococcota bacterium]
MPCDLVVLDLLLPDLSAEETALRIRQLRLGLPLVCVSGYERDHAARHLEPAGVAGFVRKPFGPQDSSRPYAAPWATRALGPGPERLRPRDTLARWPGPSSSAAR